MSRALVLGLILAAPAAIAQDVSTGQGAEMRWLDKINGDVTDMELLNNGIHQIGRMKVHLRECRYPTGNPSGDAYAFVTVAEEGASAPAFEGWMVASAPALNALEHPRYDLWVMRCKTS